MRFAWVNTTSMSCSVNSTPMPFSRTMSAVRPIRAMRSFGAIPAVGSSMSSSSGSCASATASSTRFKSPYASTLQGRCAWSRMPTISSRFDASSRYRLVASGHNARLRLWYEISAIWTFSDTDIEPKVAVI